MSQHSRVLVVPLVGPTIPSIRVFKHLYTYIYVLYIYIYNIHIKHAPTIIRFGSSFKYYFKGSAQSCRRPRLGGHGPLPGDLGYWAAKTRALGRGAGFCTLDLYTSICIVLPEFHIFLEYQVLCTLLMFVYMYIC